MKKWTCLVLISAAIFFTVSMSIAAGYVISFPRSDFPKSGVSALLDVAENPKGYIGRTFSFYVSGDYSEYMHARIDGAANKADGTVAFYFTTSVEYENFEIKKIIFDTKNSKWTAKCVDRTSNPANFKNEEIVVMYIE